MDYTAITDEPLAFSAEATVGETQCVNISILDDSELEQSEVFDVVVIIGASTVTSSVTITDNEG